jgi:hypothetical protein
MSRLFAAAALVLALAPASASAQLQAGSDVSGVPAPPTPPSSGRIDVAVGIGDQSATMFTTPQFQALGVKKVRYFIKWDAVDRPDELATADAYVAAARQAGAQVLMHVSTNDLGIKTARLPSVARYKLKVGALVARYRPLGVRTWGAFNEANHASQPTWDDPRRAAQFFLALRSVCSRCTIVALDVLDQRGVDRYIDRFYAALGTRKSLARIVGIHNYSDTNRNRDTGTRLILETVKRHHPRPKFWLTETGGVAKFGTSFPCDPAFPAAAERRQARAVNFMFTLTARFRADISRLYIYNFTGADCQTRFDAGIVRRDGTTRPAYDAVRRQLRRFKR